MTIKQELMHYNSTCDRYNYNRSQSFQRGRGGFCGRLYSRGTKNTRAQKSRNTNFKTQKQGYGNHFGQNCL